MTSFIVEFIVPKSFIGGITCVQLYIHGSSYTPTDPAFFLSVQFQLGIIQFAIGNVMPPIKNLFIITDSPLDPKQQTRDLTGSQR